MLFTITDVVGFNLVKAIPASFAGVWPKTAAVNLVAKTPVEIGGTYSFKLKNSLYRGTFVRGELDTKAKRIDTNETNTDQ